MIRLHLPFPPSVNDMYANGGKRGRHKTQKYKAWEQLASFQIRDGHRQGFGPYSLFIALRRDLKGRSDIDNRIKAVNDLLQAHGIVKNDSACELLTITWDAGIEPECVVLIQRAEEGIAS